MDCEAIVLAGGLGTRLRSRLPHTPKVLAPIQGRPFLGYLLAYLRGQKIHRVFLSLGYKADQVTSWLKQNHFSPMNVIPVVEPQPLGTGGAMAYAWRHITAECVLVLNGDTFFPISIADFYAFHLSQNVPLSIAMAYVQPADRYGLVETLDKKVQAFREKSPAPAGWIYGGIALIEAKWWLSRSWPESFSWESFLMQAVPALPIGAYAAENVPFIDIGVPEDYERAQTLIPAYASF
ncbi:MAG: sugar phosphate nucleotidyltransferase [Bacteroidia bacterium]|nr:sugar phosphate nucleotidyltransferase [Bacteroidia bacterium]MCX7652904.1 sugar phosphate nucleotidyltransferase [Bacteroidia bacterium]MDW8416628.1 sugar phosphate nucleotidyltransferase [Bacteroidia bacterium]